MNLTIFGANGPTGRLLTGLALAAGHRVVAATRHPDTFQIRHPQLRVAATDVYDKTAVAEAVRGSDAVLSSLGVPYGRAPINVYSAGVANIIDAIVSTTSPGWSWSAPARRSRTITPTAASCSTACSSR